MRKQLDDAKEGKAIRCDKVTVNDLIAELFRQYDVAARKTKEDDERRWKLQLHQFFRACKAMDVTRGMIRVYIQQRKGEKDWQGNVPKHATVNQELAVLLESYSLDVKDERLRHMLSFKGLMLEESNNVRRGFLKDSQYEVLATATAEFGLWLRAMFEVYLRFLRDVPPERSSSPPPFDSAVPVRGHPGALQNSMERLLSKNPRGQRAGSRLLLDRS